jgi:DNA-binding beta-propeller fold protein YncE
MPSFSFSTHVRLAAAAAVMLSLSGCGASGDKPVNERAQVPPMDAAGDVTDKASESAGGMLTQVGRFHHTDQSPEGWDASAAEIVAFEPECQQIFTVNGMAKAVDVLDARDVSSLTKTGVLDLSGNGAFADYGSPNSVAYSKGLIAVAVENAEKQSPGWVYFFQSADGGFVKRVVAGALPDMVTFTPDGGKALAANEGEPNADYSIDPEGSISIIAISDGEPADEATQLGFEAFNRGGPRADELPDGVRVFGNFGRTERSVSERIDESTLALRSAAGIEQGHWVTISPDPAAADGEPLAYQVASVSGTAVTFTRPLDDEATYTPGDAADATKLKVFLHDGQSSVAQDLEPEYIAVSADSMTAFVTLQENNAVAVIDLVSNTITAIRALGAKDHSLPGNELDASDGDEAVNIRSWPVQGMYQPDAIATFAAGGETFLVTANEGDARAYDGFTEETAFRDVAWGDADGAAIIEGADFSDKNGAGDLVTTVTNDGDRDGIFESRRCFGGRSFSIWTADGEQVWDSGHDFAVITADRYGLQFNNDNKKTEDDKDGRSDAKGCEPEAVAVGRVGESTYAFIGLERMGGIMVYDISSPASPRFVEYVNNRDITKQGKDFGDPDGDYGPEGFCFVPAEASPAGVPLLIVGSEVSGTTTVYRIDAPSTGAAEKPRLEDLESPE